MARRLIPCFGCVVLLTLSPFLVNAQSGATPCLGSGQKNTLSSVGGVKAQAKRQLSCASLCSDERITLTRHALSATVGVETTRQCNTPVDKQKYGCKPGQIKPKVVMVLSSAEGSKTVTLSKCDKVGVLQAINDSLDLENTKPLERLALEHAKSLLQAVAGTPDAGKQLLTDQLRAMGVDNPEALVASNPNDALEMVRAMAAGNKQKAEEIARDRLGLNDNLVSNVGRLTDEARAASGNTPNGDFSAAGAQQPTGFEQGKPLPGGAYGQMFKSAEDKYGIGEYAPGILAMEAKVESGGNPNICSPTGACGLFQYIPGTWNEWSRRWNYATNGVNAPLPQSDRFNPELSTKVTAFYISENWRMHGNLIQQSGMNPTAALYAIHNIGDTGGPRFIQAYANNPNELVRNVLNSTSIRWNPGLYGSGNITLAQAEQRILSLMSGNTNFAASRYAGVGATPFAVGGDYPSAYVGASPYALGTPTHTGSPMGGVAPSAPAYAPVPSYVPLSGASGGTSGVGLPTPNGTGQGSTAIFQPTPIKPVLSIVAEPRDVEKGKPIVVSWSSVGTTRSVTCEVSHKQPNRTTRISQDKEGSKIIQTGSIEAGAHTFIFECKTQSGETFKKDVTVTVR